MMLKQGVTSVKEHHTEGSVRAEALLADTFQPRNLEGVSDECKTAVKDQEKSIGTWQWRWPWQ